MMCSTVVGSLAETKLRTAVIPMTPPLAASLRMASSVLSRGWSLSARQLEWVTAIGPLDSSMASRVVRSPEWETSISMPTSFIFWMIWAP